MNVASLPYLIMSLPSRFARAFGHLSVVRQTEKLIGHLKLALSAAILAFVSIFFCMLIASAYFLMHLLQGR